MPRGRALASGIRTDYETPFGPSQVTMQPADAGVVTEDYTAALDGPWMPPLACRPIRVSRWPPAADTWLTEPARTSTWTRTSRHSRCFRPRTVTEQLRPAPVGQADPGQRSSDADWRRPVRAVRGCRRFAGKCNNSLFHVILHR